MSEIILQLKNPADESVVFEFLQKMGIAFSISQKKSCTEEQLEHHRNIIQQGIKDES